MARTTLVAVSIMASLPAAADVVHFVNGDRLTGSAVDAAPGVVAIDVPQLGVVSVPSGLVARVDKEQPPSGAPTGPSAPAALTASPAPASTIAKLIDAWDVQADLAMTTASGNTDTSDFNLVAGATRVGERFDSVFGAAWHKAEVDQADAKDQLDLNYDLRWKYSESWYAVANFEYFRDPIKDIERRYTTGAGVGHTFWTSPRGSLSTDGGVSQVFERLASATEPGKSDSNPALRWSLSYQHWLAPDRLEVFHNNQLLHILASDRGMVWDSDTGFRFHVNNHWQAGLRLDLQHETTPAAGRGRTDAGYALSLGVKL